MKFKHLLLPALALMACGALEAQTSDSTSSPSPGNGDHGHWRRHHHAWIWGKLNLTDDQKKQIKSIRQGAKTQFRPALAAVLTARMKLQQDIENNEEAIPADTTVLAGAMSKLASIRATVLSQIKGVLTQEQQSAWNDFQQKRQTRLQNWINKLNQPET